MEDDRSDALDAYLLHASMTLPFTCDGFIYIYIYIYILLEAD